MNADRLASLSKVPEVVLGFWIIKVLATTLGETGGDAVSMSMNLGYLVSTGIFMVFSQTLGTALGDWTADSAGLGYKGAALVFGGLLLLVFFAYLWTRIPRTWLFWAAFILTRPLGAVVGDFLDKPLAKGGLELSRYSASAVLLVLIIVCILVFPQRPAKWAH